MSGYRHWLVAQPAYDCALVQPCRFGKKSCTPTSPNRHGRHGVDLRWYCEGPVGGSLGVVQFALYTNWMLDETWDDPEYRRFMQDGVVRHSRPGEPGMVTPMPADLGFHWPIPQYGGQEESGTMGCDLLVEGECYYDGSGLNASQPWHILRHEGDKALRLFLEDYHAQLVGDIR